MTRFRTALLALLCYSMNTLAQTSIQPKSPGIEATGYVWNVVQNEELRALRSSADAQRGAIAYAVCHGCHKAGGVGTPDGLYPRLAGQHDTFIIKQLVDVRAGRRDNPTMYPFASEHAINTQEIADLAAYLSGLPPLPDNGKGDGQNLSRGKTLYAKDCTTCHGNQGEGIADQFYPRVAGQHYQYLKKEIRNIRDGSRRNANPKMVAVVKSYSDSDLNAVADYMSRLPGATGKSLER